VDAARQTFSLGGYDGVSIEDVIAAVGISKPTFYSHFPSKDALAVRILVNDVARVRQQLEAFAAAMPASDAVRAMIDWAIRDQFTAPGPQSFPGGMSFFGRDEVRHAERALTHRLAELIEQGHMEGAINKTATPDLLALTFRSILRDVALFKERSASAAEIAALSEEVQTLLLGVRIQSALHSR